MLDWWLVIWQADIRRTDVRFRGSYTTIWVLELRAQNGFDFYRPVHSHQRLNSRNKRRSQYLCRSSLHRRCRIELLGKLKLTNNRPVRCWILVESFPEREKLEYLIARNRQRRHRSPLAHEPLTSTTASWWLFSVQAGNIGKPRRFSLVYHDGQDTGRNCVKPDREQKEEANGTTSSAKWHRRPYRGWVTTSNHDCTDQDSRWRQEAATNESNNGCPSYAPSQLVDQPG